MRSSRINWNSTSTISIPAKHIPCSHQSLFSEIGGAISEFYAKATPKMKDFDIHVFVWVVGHDVVIGTQLNVKELSKDRHNLVYRNQVSIKVSVVYGGVSCMVLDYHCSQSLYM